MLPSSCHHRLPCLRLKSSRRWRPRGGAAQLFDCLSWALQDAARSSGPPGRHAKRQPLCCRQPSVDPTAKCRPTLHSSVPLAVHAAAASRQRPSGSASGDAPAAVQHRAMTRTRHVQCHGTPVSRWPILRHGAYLNAHAAAQPEQPVTAPQRCSFSTDTHASAAFLCWPPCGALAADPYCSVPLDGRVEKPAITRWHRQPVTTPHRRCSMPTVANRLVSNSSQRTGISTS